MPGERSRPTDDDRVDRRTVLGTVGAAFGLALAGCGTPGGQAVDATETPAAGGDRTTTATATTREGTDATTDEPTRTTAEGTPGNATERGDYTVGCYTELYFDPIGLAVQPGETVSFEMVSGAHSATAYHPDNPSALRRRIPDGAPAWNTGTWSEQGTIRNVTFRTPGTHDYYCIPHKAVGMVGRIVVGEPGGPAEDSPNPDDPLPAADRIVVEGAVPYDDWATTTN